MAAVPLRAADGHVIAFAGSAVDVTERERGDQRLRAQVAFQNLLLETSPQPMMLTDLAHRVVLVNRSWEQAMGCPREHIVGERRALYPGEEADNAALSAGGGTTLERDLPYGDGTRRATRVLKAAVHGDRGDVTGVLSILVDISEFREAERATREAYDAAEEAARTRTQFVANMSHELRTPLQAIIGFAELGSARSQDERLGAMFTDILAAGQRMLALVNDLLDVAKIESDIGTIHLERTDLRGHIRTVARELGPWSRRAGRICASTCRSIPWWHGRIRGASSRSCATCWPTPSSSLPTARASSCAPAWMPRTPSASKCRTRAPAYRPPSWNASSTPSPSRAARATAPAARAWAWPSAARSWKHWRAASTRATWKAAPSSASSFLPAGRETPYLPPSERAGPARTRLWWSARSAAGRRGPSFHPTSTHFHRDPP